MLILNQTEIQKILPLSKIEEAINEVEKAFLSCHSGKAQMPSKNYLYCKRHNGDIRVMPAFVPELNMAGTKIVNVHPDNSSKGLPTVMAVIILNDAQTGLPLVLMDGTYITCMRTGAAGAVAVKYLAREDTSTLGIVGAGQQALSQIAAISKVRKIDEIFVYDINPGNIKKLAKRLEELEIEIQEASIEKAASSDILVTITPSREAIIKKEWISPGAHINAIGADAQGKQEIESAILKEGKIVIDDWEQASHSGEINVPLSKGILKREDIHACLGEVISGLKPGRENKEEITIFDSTGLAIQDLFTANFVYNEAKAKKIGREINLF